MKAAGGSDMLGKPFMSTARIIARHSRQYVYGDGRFVYLHNGVVTEVQIRTVGRQQP